MLISLVVLLLFTPSLSYEPDIDLPTPKLIKRHGYRAESHEVLTEDGYILTIHRIPNSPNNKEKTPILLQHGILASSAAWVINGPLENRSLAYIMADRGYDIWLGNVRGNVYSRAHISKSPSDNAFWEFSWHEMGYYDLAATIDYILNVTGHSSLYYVGHSMGTTMSYVLCSTRPDYNIKFKMLFSLAPIAFLGGAKSPLHYIAPYAKDIELVTKWFGAGEFLPRNTLMNYILKISCENSILQAKLCEDYIFIVCGYDPMQFNMNLLPVILGHSPAGTSTKSLVHFAQEMKSERFCQYDYGDKINMEIYGTKDSPEYSLNNIVAPVSLHYADNDLLANTKDVMDFYHTLPNKVGLFRVNFSSFNHLDFLWSIDIYKLLFSQLEMMMIKYDTFKGFKLTHKTILRKKLRQSFKNEQNTLDFSKVLPVSQKENQDPGYIAGIREVLSSKIEDLKGTLPNIHDILVNKLEMAKTYITEKWQKEK